ncbi:hypothetical protein ACWCYZ_00855 [Streptomyces virginiae]|uniref:hypothetical protein n=1 Tax=Streptomyces TaxID=1883 RepID=UPI000F3A9F56|nr:hypothetical protein [Streptomyces sp. ADI95-16]AYV29651.1 hypothetical protein EES41_23325 [Streptomyces sp. ADI95-16]
MNEITLEGEAVARAAYNALAFTPARSPIPAAMFYVSDGEVYFLATDTYAIGRPTLGHIAEPNRQVAIELTREDLASLDRLGRACKGEVRVSMPDDRGLIVSAVQVAMQEVIPDRAGALTYDREIWDLCHSLLDQLDERNADVPELVALDPTLLSRFGKIKTPRGTSPMLDMKIVSEKEPILIKCGPQFRGALMPVDREVAGTAATRGGDFLW